MASNVLSHEPYVVCLLVLKVMNVSLVNFSPLNDTIGPFSPSEE